MVGINEQEAKIVKRYPWEVSTIILLITVAFLFGVYAGLVSFIRTDLMELQVKSNTVMQNCSNALDNNTSVLQQVKAKIP